MFFFSLGRWYLAFISFVRSQGVLDLELQKGHEPFKEYLPLICLTPNSYGLCVYSTHKSNGPCSVFILGISGRKLGSQLKLLSYVLCYMIFFLIFPHLAKCSFFFFQVSSRVFKGRKIKEIVLLPKQPMKCL